MKKILIISSSLRSGGNSEALADEFMRGASEAGHATEKISFVNKKIAFCKGCFACGKLGSCVISDHGVEIASKMGEADAIAFATPIYYYGMCGQMKTMLDRANPLFNTEYKFRNIYLLAAAADDDETAADKTEIGLQGWVDCFPKAHLAGKVLACGVNDVGDIKGHIALNAAYEMGKQAFAEKE